MTERYRNFNKGFSLVELLVTIALVSAILAVVLPQYTSLLRHSTATRKTVKTDVEVVSNLEQFFKDVHTAGYGLPGATDNLNIIQCTRNGGITVDGNSVVIRSTASGDRVGAGKWAMVSGDGNSLTSSVISGGSFVMVLDVTRSSPKSLGLFRVENNLSLTAIGTSVASRDQLAGKIAYWVPMKDPNSRVECYETSYALENYSEGTRPNMCAPTAGVLRRSKTPADFNNESPQPTLDCVKAMAVRLGCLSSSGLTWRSGECEEHEVVKLARVGIVYQVAPREKTRVYPHSSISLFSDLGTELVENINFSDEERYYRWAVLEKTVYLPNTE